MAVQPISGSKRAARTGFLLDLITGAETDHESLRRLAEAGALALSGTAGIDCAATLHRPGNPPVTSGSTGTADCLAASEDRYGDGPMVQAASAGEPVQVTGDGTSQRWQAYRRRLVASGYGAALAVQLGLEGRTSCTLVFLGPAEFEFAPDMVAEASWFAAVATESMNLAIEVRSVRSAGDNLKAVLESRTSIDVACGVIMAQNRCSYPDAFGKLAAVSRQRNLKVRNVAENILKALTGGPPATRFEPPALA